MKSLYTYSFNLHCIFASQDLTSFLLEETEKKKKMSANIFFQDFLFNTLLCYLYVYSHIKGVVKIFLRNSVQYDGKMETKGVYNDNNN